MKSYNSKVKPVGVGNVYLIIKLTVHNFFWKILYESSPFGFGKANENEIFVLIFEKVTNVLGETSSYTFLSNIS